MTTASFSKTTDQENLRWLILMLIMVGAIKNPAETPLYLNSLLLVAGLLVLAVERKITPEFYPALLLIGLGLITAIYNGYVDSIARLCQMALIILAASYVARGHADELVEYVSRYLVPIIFIVFIAEILWVGTIRSRVFAGIELPRYIGIQGDPNFNATLYGIIGLLIFSAGWKLRAVAIWIIALFSFSRGFVFGLLICMIALPFRRTFFIRLIYWPIIVTLLSVPAIVFFVDSVIADETRTMLTEISSRRYDHWLSYLKMGLDHPLGVGYFQSVDLQAQYWPHHTWENQEAHSMFFQVFSEFGFIGYGIFCYFVLGVARKVVSVDYDNAPIFLYLMVAYSLLNALSEWGFWIGLAVLLSTSLQDAHRDAT